MTRAVALASTGQPPRERSCSSRSRTREDPLWGTAGRGDRWFLIEVAAGWGWHPFLDAPFDRELGRQLVTRIEAAGMRPLAIRKHGPRAEPRRWRFATVDTRPQVTSIRWGEVAEPCELLTVPLDGTAGHPSVEPLFAVCAHGRHDQCCAVRGRPVARELAERFPEETWECSHLGGDRFAATMVLFPDGLVYGRVDATDPVAIAQAYRQGRVEDRWLRGRSCFSMPVQAAQHFARETFGDDRIDAYLPLAERLTDSGAIVTLAARPYPAGADAPRSRTAPRDAAAESASGEDPEYTGAGRGAESAPTEITIRLDRVLSEPLLSMCSATEPTPVPEWQLVSLTLTE